MEDECYDINSCARTYSLLIWNIILDEPVVAIFILFVNYFFAIIPTISIFFAKYTQIKNDKNKNKFLTNIIQYLSYIFYLLPFFVNIYQLLVFKRVISFRMTRTFFFGQLVALPLYILSFYINNVFKYINLKTYYVLLILSLIYLIIFIVYLFTLSEFVMPDF